MVIPPTPLSVRNRWQDFLGALPDFDAGLFLTAAGTGLVVSLPDLASGRSFRGTS